MEILIILILPVVMGIFYTLKQREESKLDIGEEEVTGTAANFSNAEFLSYSSEKGHFHSHLCDRYNSNPNHDINTCINTRVYDGTPEMNIEIPKIGFDLYFVVGANVNFGFDYKRFCDEARIIWDE